MTARTGTRTRDRGVASLEMLGMMPVVLATIVAVLQAGAVALTASSTAEAARSAARAATLHQDPYAAARDSLPGVLTPESVTGSDSGGQASYTVAVRIPGIGFFSDDLGTITRTVVMPDLVTP